MFLRRRRRPGAGSREQPDRLGRAGNGSEHVGRSSTAPPTVTVYIASTTQERGAREKPLDERAAPASSSRAAGCRAPAGADDGEREARARDKSIALRPRRPAPGATTPATSARAAWFTRRQQLVERLHHVVDLALGVEDQAAAVGEVRARPVHAEEVGKFGTVMPRYADGSSPHCSRSTAPSRPTISIGQGSSLCRKPVA